ncbi:hypothetical protein [Alicyclobacillus pomorum]|uniref:hypothetical protein n=1 Tax=Alicyclobacillus pomorum TaxID=204470 RepID=UPI000426579F|nr:hypothetical protein [Alicyclobacillus pomorum]
MPKFIASYVAFEVLIVVLAVIATLWVRYHRRTRQSGKPPIGFVRTDEVFVDPTTGVTQRVWFNPQTGERFYETVGKR